MKTSPHHARLLALISGVLLFTSAAAAELPDEIIVRGTRSELELDDSAWRIDMKRHVSRVAGNVRSTLALRSTEPLVATTRDRERG